MKKSILLLIIIFLVSMVNAQEHTSCKQGDVKVDKCDKQIMIVKGDHCKSIQDKHNCGKQEKGCKSGKSSCNKMEKSICHKEYGNKNCKSSNRCDMSQMNCCKSKMKCNDSHMNCCKSKCGHKKNKHHWSIWDMFSHRSCCNYL